ncbi:hypothetical protein FRC00_003750 [Tulasnella sp. 408]|nr:hypothetical protein FRC00_003750 [Tulasnella sp. 408]
MTPLPPHQIIDDESEGDEDYVPPEKKEADSESDDGARKTKKARLSGPVQEEQAPKSAETLKAERDALWAEFQASAASSSNVNTREDKPKMVKVRVTHKFAGEEVIEVKEVEEGSAEAKKWPVVAAEKGEDRVQGSASGTTSYENPIWQLAAEEIGTRTKASGKAQIIACSFGRFD